jgi:hypothetical protein
MTISEPATLVTDYLLAVFTAVLAGRVRSVSRWWAAAFAATAVAGAAGGTVHGFQHAFEPRVTSILWLLTLESLVGAGYAVVRAALARTSWGRRRGWTAAARAAFAAFAVLVVINPVFLSAIAAYGTALAVLASTCLSEWPQTGGARLLLAGIGVSVAAAAIQQSGWSLHRHFNHNDLYHVVQAAAVWLLYRGAIADAAAGNAS